MEKSLFLCYLVLSFQKSTVAATYVHKTLSRITGKTNKLLRIGSSKFIHRASRLRINFMIHFFNHVMVTWALVGWAENPPPNKTVPLQMMSSVLKGVRTEQLSPQQLR